MIRKYLLILFVILISVGVTSAYAYYLFTPPINISNNIGTFVASSVATNGTNIFVAWYDYTDGEIFFSNSTDDGTTFSTPINISNDPGESFNPRITTDGTNIFVTWYDFTNGDIFFSNSTDGGTTFSTPINISNLSGSNRFPSIAIDGTNIFVTWHNYTDGEIFFSNSTDGGTTFSIPKNISNNIGTSYYPSIATNGTNIFVVWYDSSLADIEIFFSNSTDGGTTFSTPINVSQTQSSSFRPSIATDGTDIFVTWYESPTDNYEILFSKSVDGGTTFSTPINISNSDDTSFDPRIATYGTNIFVVYFDHSSGNWEILFTNSTDGGTTFSTPINISNNLDSSNSPDIITTDTDIYVTWHDFLSGNSVIKFSKGTVLTECNPSISNWIITTSCTLENSFLAQSNVTVQNNSVLVIPSGVTLDIDFANFNLTVKLGSGVLIKSGGAIT